MTCSNCQTAEGRRYTYRLRLLVRIAVLCDSCVERLTAMGLVLTAEGEPPKPRWLSRLTAREDGSWGTT